MVPGEQAQSRFTIASPLPPDQAISMEIGSQIVGQVFSTGTVGLASASVRPGIRFPGFKVATGATGEIAQSIAAVSRWATEKPAPISLGTAQSSSKSIPMAAE